MQDLPNSRNNRNLGLKALCNYDADNKNADMRERVECCMSHCIHPFGICSTFCKKDDKYKDICMNACAEQREVCTSMCINEVDDDIRNCIDKYGCVNLDSIDLQCLERNRKNINNCCKETCKLDTNNYGSCDNDCEYLNNILKQYENIKSVLDKNRQKKVSIEISHKQDVIYIYIILTIILLIVLYIYLKTLIVRK